MILQLKVTILPSTLQKTTVLKQQILEKTMQAAGTYQALQSYSRFMQMEKEQMVQRIVKQTDEQFALRLDVSQSVHSLDCHDSCLFEVAFS